MKALVLGSNGYLGRHLVHFARSREWDVRTSDIQPRAWDNDRKYISCDLRARNSLATLDWRVDLVFLFAGVSGTTVGFNRYEEFIDGNEKTLLAILETIRRMMPDGPKLVFPSSRLVYRGAPGVPLKESAELDCRSIYAANKRAAELYIELYRKVFGLRAAIFRICVPYGSVCNQTYSYGTVGFFLLHALAGRDIPVYGDGAQRRTFTHIEDVCSQILLAAPMPETDHCILNINGAEHLSIWEAAAMVAEHCSVRVESVEWPTLDWACESGDTIFDGTKLSQLIRHKCQHTFGRWVNTMPRRHNTTF